MKSNCCHHLSPNVNLPVFFNGLQYSRFSLFMKVCNLFCELLYQIITCTFVVHGIIRGAVTNDPVRTIMAGFTTI